MASRRANKPMSMTQIYVYDPFRVTDDWDMFLGIAICQKVTIQQDLQNGHVHIRQITKLRLTASS